MGFHICNRYLNNRKQILKIVSKRRKEENRKENYQHLPFENNNWIELAPNV